MSKMHALEVFYGLIYVVIEGFRELRCADETVSVLLAKEDYVDLLRRFRNGVFHYQKDPIDSRLFDFMVREDSEIWVRDIHVALGKYLERRLSIREGVEQFSRMFANDRDNGSPKSTLERFSRIFRPR